MAFFFPIRQTWIWRIAGRLVSVQLVRNRHPERIVTIRGILPEK
jgi:hypothetical protein